MQLGPQVDDREAYLDAVLLNVYGGPGATNVWIDDLEVAGHVPRSAGSRAAAAEQLRPAGHGAVAAEDCRWRRSACLRSRRRRRRPPPRGTR